MSSNTFCSDWHIHSRVEAAVNGRRRLPDVLKPPQGQTSAPMTLMMRALTTFFTLIIALSGGSVMAETNVKVDTVSHFTFEPLIGGDAFPLSDYSGQVIMIVNTASNCGFTKQYEGLERLYQTYKDRGFVIIGVPSNDFGSQEPGSNEEIAQFCKINFGVSFPVTTKYRVRGEDAHLFYQSARKMLGFAAAPKWNFHKYLIGRDQQLVDYFHSTTAPDAKRLIQAVENALGPIPD